MKAPLRKTEPTKICHHCAHDDRSKTSQRKLCGPAKGYNGESNLPGF